MYRHLRVVQLAALLVIALGLQTAEARYGGSGGGHGGGYGGRSHAGYAGGGRGGYRGPASYAGGSRSGYRSPPVHPRAPTVGLGGYGSGVGRYPTQRAPANVMGRGPYTSPPTRGPHPPHLGPYVPPKVRIGGWHPYSPVARPVPTARYVPPRVSPPTVRYVTPRVSTPTVRYVPPAASTPTTRYVPPRVSSPTARYVPPRVSTPTARVVPSPASTPTAGVAPPPASISTAGVAPPPASISTAGVAPSPASIPTAGVAPPPASVPTTRFVPPPILRPVGELKPNVVTPRPTERRYVEGEVLILTRGGTPESLRAAEDQLGLTPVQNAQISLLGGTLHRYRLRLNADLESTIATLRGFAVVAAAEPNFKFQLEDDTAKTVSYQPNPAPSPDMPLQYAVEVLHLHEAHALSEGSGVRVAVIDSGLDETNPELSDRVVDRFDAVGGSFTAHQHGTAMGGAIVAHRDLVGIAPKAQLIAIRAFSGASSVADGNGFDILRSLEFAVTHGARVVNMSFAGPRDQLLQEAIAAARRQGVVTVAAAGNGGPLASPQYPAAEPGVIAVTATDARGTAFAGANRGSYIAVAAPGVQIVAPSVGNAIQICSGTSIATAEVSGIVALLLERSATATPDDIRRILSNSAHPLSVERTAGGAGIVDAVAAIRYTAAQ